MKIAVLVGSPKGEMSITLQYVKYLQKKLPEHSFNTVHIGHQIKKIEKDPTAFQAVLNAVQQSDGILWCFPVYFFLVPSQLKRFIELVLERHAEGAFAGKVATALTTSVHFFDHTAHNYIQAISEDLGMNYRRGLSAEMEDLQKPEQRDNLVAFARNFLRAIATKTPVERAFTPVAYGVPEYRPPVVAETAKTGTRKIVLLTDEGASDTNLRRMTNLFVQCLPNAVEVINISQIDIKGGCLGCCRCAADNVCVYHDDMMTLFKERLMPADAIIYAGSIRDRYLSARWKMFMDRSFFNGHSPVLQGKQVAWIISGPLRQMSNLRQLLEGESEISRTNLVGIVTDEDENSDRITTLLKDVGTRVLRSIEEKTPFQPTFLGVGGHKLFRDLIYELRFVFKADYRFYKKYGMFDYPQKSIRKRLRNGYLSLLTAIPAFRSVFYRMAMAKMLEPYQKIVNKA